MAKTLVNVKDKMGELKKWREQKWVRIGTDGSILGPCGTSKNKKILTDVYLCQKQGLYLNQKELQLLKRKKEKEGLEDNLFQTQNKLK